MELTQVIWPTPRLWPAMWKSLKSAKSSAFAVLSSDQEAEKIFCPSSSSDTLAMRAIRSAILRSRTVQVGDLNMTVSETIAAAIMPASFSEGISPRS